MQSPRAWLSRVWDVRAGEWLTVILAFLVLLLVISAHTILETTRDTLLLTKLPVRQLGLVYIAVAICALPSATLAGHASKRFGPRRALVGGLVTASVLAVVFFLLPVDRASVIALYVGSALIATMVVPQFWTLLDAGLTGAQARRLFGPIASAGVFGGVLGSSLAAATLAWLPVKMLLIGSSAIFLMAAGAVAFFPFTERSVPAPARQGSMSLSMRDVRQEPFLLRLTLVVAVSTAAVLAVDYFFKWTIARTVPPAHIGTFVSRYYAGLNIASLVVQLFLGAALVRKVGLAAAIIVTPVFLALGAVTALLFGGALLAVLAMKGIDGSLRYSVHRITTELLYLPLGPGLRERAKPIIDGAVVRVAQALTAALLLALGGTSFLSPRLFAAIVVVLGVAWAAIAYAIRGPYLDLLRDAVSEGATDRRYPTDPLDLTSAEVLVEFLASSDPLEVIAAMNTLERRGSARLVPALILYHHDERVLRRALEILSASARADWVTLARVLLDHPSEAVRMSVTRALATHGWLPFERLGSDTSARVKGYAILTIALRDRPSDVVNDPRIVDILERTGQAGEDARLGLMTAIADATGEEPLADLLLKLTTPEPQGQGSEWIELAARAIRHRGDARLVSFLIAHLAMRQGREAVREALAGLGEPAFDEVWKTLRDGTQDRRLRVQLPATLAAFANRAAAEKLLENVETELDGLVRYKSIRALARVVVFHNVRVNRQRAEKLAHANLVEYFQILGRRVALQAGQRDALPEDGGLVARTARLLPGLLDDKLDHSLERAFRLLKVAHPREDIHRVYIACRSNDRNARARAGELLDALFTHRDQQQLRELLRLVADDLTPAERIARSVPYLGFLPPPSHDAAVLELIDDHDVGVAALAALYATGIGRPALRDAAEAARERRSEIGLTAVRLFGPPGSPDVGAIGREQAADG